MLTSIAVAALGAVGIASVARAVAPADLRQRKPFSCDLCSAWWGSVLMLFVPLAHPGVSFAETREAAVLLLPTVGAAWSILAYVAPERSAPSVLDP